MSGEPPFLYQGPGVFSQTPTSVLLTYQQALSPVNPVTNQTVPGTASQKCGWSVCEEAFLGRTCANHSQAPCPRVGSDEP